MSSITQHINPEDSICSSISFSSYKGLIL